jgi:MAternally-affected-uncoordination protein
MLGTLALQLHDAGQAREILKSSLTLAKTLFDIPTQIWILSVFTGKPYMLCGFLLKAI